MESRGSGIEILESNGIDWNRMGIEWSRVRRTELVGVDTEWKREESSGGGVEAVRVETNGDRMEASGTEWSRMDSSGIECGWSLSLCVCVCVSVCVCVCV